MEALIKNCADELPNVDDASSFVATHRSDAPLQCNEAGSIVYIQTPEQMRAGQHNIGKINAAMKQLLEKTTHLTVS